MKRLTILAIVLLLALPMAAQLRVIQTRSGAGVLAAPTFSGDTGAAQSVTITPPGSATICYTIDGSDPAASTPGTCSAGSTYSAPVAITVTTTFKALATMAGFINSSIASQTYTISAGSPITHVASGTGCSGQGQGLGAANPFTFSCTAQSATNHAVIFTVECLPGSGTVSAVSLTATGWTFTAIGTLQVSGNSYAQTFGAIVPNTSAATFTATFTGATNCTNFNSHLHDELAVVDATGGATTFYASSQVVATTTGCSAPTAATSSSSNDMVYGICLDNLPTSSWNGATWNAGVNDTQGDATVYKNASGATTPSFSGSTTGTALLKTLVIKAQ